MMRTPIGSIALLSVVAWVGGCAHQESPANGPNGPGDMPLPALDGGDAAVVSTLPPRTGPSEGQELSTVSNGRPLADTINDVPPVGATDLTDAQILEVAHVVNRGDIEQSELAASKGRDDEVKAFARAMARDRTASDSEATALARAVGLSAAKSGTSMSLADQTRDVASTLSEQEGVELDRSYLDSQIKQHRAVLDMLQQKLLPDAKNAGLKTYLAEVQARVARDLQQAQTLRGALDLRSSTSATRGM
jgi:putative membrane protein